MPPAAPGILCGMRHAGLTLSDAFSRVVAKHREANGLSRSALARLAGLHQTYMGLLERGERSHQSGHRQRNCPGLG